MIRIVYYATLTRSSIPSNTRANIVLFDKNKNYEELILHRIAQNIILLHNFIIYTYRQMYLLQIYPLLFIFFPFFFRGNKYFFEERSNKVGFFVDINKHRMIVRPEEDTA